MFKKFRTNRHTEKLLEGNLKQKIEAARFLAHDQAALDEWVPRFIEHLESPHDNVRYEAVVLLGEFRDPRAGEPLRPMLVHPGPQIRTAAATALEQLGDSGWVDALQGDEDDFVRLGKMNGRDAFVLLENVLQNPGHPSFLSAAGAMAHIENKRAVQPLTRLLAERSSDVRNVVIPALGKLDRDTVLETLLPLASTPRASYRHGVTLALSHLREPRAADTLLQLLADDESAVRSAAAQGLDALGQTQWKQWLKGDDQDFQRLAQSGEPGAVEILGFALQASNPFARIDAAMAMAENPSPENLRELEPHFSSLLELPAHPELQIRLAAVRLMGKLHLPGAVPMLVQMLSDEAGRLRNDAAEALMQFPVDDPAVKEAVLPQGEVLTYALENPEEPVRRCAIHLLALLPPEEVVPVLFPRLLDAEPEVRTSIAVTLARLGETQWQDMVKGKPGDFPRLLDSGDTRVAETIFRFTQEPPENWPRGIAEALAKSGDPDAVPALAEALKTRESERTVIIGALAAFNDPRASTPLLNILPALSRDETITAVRLLGQWQVRAALQPIRQRLQASDPDVRKTAAEAMAQLGETKWQQWIKGNDDDFDRLKNSGDNDAHNFFKKLLEDALNALKSDRENKKLAAIEKLGSLGLQGALQPLVNLVNSSNSQYREAAAAALEKGAFKPGSLVKPLLGQLSHPGGKGIPLVHKILRSLDEEALAEPMGKYIMEENDRALHAAEVLAGVREPWAADLLIKALENRCSDVLKVAAESLGKRKEARAVEPLTLLLDDYREDVRRAGLNAMEMLKDSRSREAVFKCIFDPDVKIRRKAAAILGDLGEPQWSECIRGQDSDFARIGQLGDQTLSPLLFRMLSHGSGETRAAAAKALDEMDDFDWKSWVKGTQNDFQRIGASRHPRAFEILQRVMEPFGHSPDQAAALEGMAKMGEPRAEPYFLKALDSAEGETGMIAAAALCRLGNMKGFPILMDRLNYYPEDYSGLDVRRKAAQHLVELYRTNKLRGAELAKFETKRNFIRAPHEDTHHYRSSDCGSSHNDSGGLGLPF